MHNLVSIEKIENKIYYFRGKKVMLDQDLAELYEVKTKYLNKQVRRNIDRLPEDFVFQISKEESLRFQIGTSKRGGRRYLPFVFTEQGIAMLSSVLNSERAIQVNIQIMRTFVKIREIFASHKDLREKIEAMESKYDGQFKVVFDAIKALLAPKVNRKRRIGFLRDRG